MLEGEKVLVMVKGDISFVESNCVYKHKYLFITQNIYQLIQK